MEFFDHDSVAVVERSKRKIPGVGDVIVELHFDTREGNLWFLHSARLLRRDRDGAHLASLRVVEKVRWFVPGVRGFEEVRRRRFQERSRSF